MALISWSAVVVLYEPALMLLANEWDLGRVSAAILTSTITAVTVAIALFSAEAPLSDLGYWVTRWLLPASILVTALFVGWVLPRPILRGELFREPAWLFRLWWWLLRWCAPICCVLWLILG
jgi:NSS family neurotransmitter:Na+ symporter